ncbi:MAG: hypothetical protein IJ794_04150 [Lachnospiraceae bacterium]|nr:hypothetical protein [Lachnospiraceae bacterium]
MSMFSDPMNEKEYRSSGWALLLVGGVGMILAVLGAVGVIPATVANPYMFYGVMMAVFVLFLVMGALSFKSAKGAAEKTKADNTLMEAVEAWCMENLTAEEIDAKAAEQTNAVIDSDEDDEQVLYFIRSEYIKRRINTQFINLNQIQLDRFLDEKLYDQFFGSTEQAQEETEV